MVCYAVFSFFKFSKILFLYVFLSLPSKTSQDLCLVYCWTGVALWLSPLNCYLSEKCLYFNFRCSRASEHFYRLCKIVYSSWPARNTTASLRSVTMMLLVSSARRGPAEKCRRKLEEHRNPAWCLFSSFNLLKMLFDFLLVCNVSAKKQAFIFNFGHLDVYCFSLVALNIFFISGLQQFYYDVLCCAVLCVCVCVCVSFVIGLEFCVGGNITFINLEENIGHYLKYFFPPSFWDFKYPCARPLGTVHSSVSALRWFRLSPLGSAATTDLPLTLSRDTLLL